MKTRQVPIIPVSHIPRAIRLVATPTTGQKSRQVRLLQCHPMPPPSPFCSTLIKSSVPVYTLQLPVPDLPGQSFPVVPCGAWLFS